MTCIENVDCNLYYHFFFLMILRPPRSTLFPTRRSSDLDSAADDLHRLSSRLVIGSGINRQIIDRKSTRLNSSHGYISYAVFCLKKKTTKTDPTYLTHTSLL